MASSATSQVDLECGEVHCHRSSSASRRGGESTDDEDNSVCFSDAEEGSCYSQFYSTADGSHDDFSNAFASDNEIGEVIHSRRASSVAESDFSVDIESGVAEIKSHLAKVERDCRICHLSLETASPDRAGIAIELGCSCKDDLAAAHKHCAETWFKIKGNKICEICNSVACNVVGVIDESAVQTNESNMTATSTAVAVATPTTEETQRGCLNGHRFLNFLLACMVLAFVISWLFHFNIPA